MELGVVLACVLAFACAVAATLSAAYTIRSTPARMIEALKATQERCDATVAEVTALRVTWTKHRAELEGVLEAMEDTLETVDRKRRRAVSAASKVAAAEEGAPLDPLELRRRARAQGAPV